MMHTLTITFETVAKSPIIGFYEFEKIYLDTSLTHIKPTNPVEISIYGLKGEAEQGHTGYFFIHDEGYSDLQFRVVFEVEIKLGENAIKRLKTGPKLTPPLPEQDFKKLETCNSELVNGLIKYIAWRKGYRVSKDYKSRIQDFWKWSVESYSGDNFNEPRYVADGYYAPGRPLFSTLTPDEFQDFYHLHRSGQTIPLHHELLLEAHSLLKTDKARSSYMILYSALEVATKTLIKHIKPDTEWLINKVQSPDLKTLYKDYINDKIVQNLVSTDDLTIIHNMTTKRNAIAHTGEAVQNDTLQNHYKFVKGLIDKIDTAMGYTWVVKMPVTQDFLVSYPGAL